VSLNSADDEPNLRRVQGAYDSEAVDLTNGDYVPNVTCRAFYVGTSGDVTIVTPGGNTTTFSSVPAGSVIPQAFTRIVQVSTTASGIVAMA